MSDIQTWDPSAINNQQPAPDGWPENTMVISQVNDAGRELMAAVARWYLDTNGSLVSTGTGAAYTVTPNRTISAYFDGLVIAFEAHATNTAAPTLALTGLAAKGIRAPGASAGIGAGAILSGGKYSVVFDADADRWQLLGAVDSLVNLGALSPDIGVLIQGNAAGTAWQTGASDAPLPPGNDLDQAINTGVYVTNDTTGNQPSTFLTVFVLRRQADRTTQIAISTVNSPPQMYWRNQGPGGWAAWQQVATTTPSVTRQVFTSSGTWNKPAQGTVAYVQCWGGGGGGGVGGSSDPGGGGGGGAYNEVWIPLSSLGSSETVTVGTGGAGQTGSQGLGGAGGNSSFGSHVLAFGGGGGFGDTNANGDRGGGGGGQTSAGAAGNAGGAGGGPGGAPAGGIAVAGGGGGGVGSGTPSTSGGDAVWGGGGGGAPEGGNSLMGGGGGSGSGIGGTPGVSVRGGNGGAEATNGSIPGGGGGGAENNIDAGSGARGEVIVTVF